MRTARDQHDGGRSRPLRVIAGVAVGALVVASAVVVIDALSTTSCDDVTFRTSAGPIDPSRRPPPIGERGVVRDLRQIFHGGSAAVFCDDFPDPFVLHVDGAYYAYATNTAGHNVPVLAASAVFRTGGDRSDALPDLPSWAEPGATWAPSVLARGEGFVLYYSARTEGRECLSAAVASDPAGPFVDDSTVPLDCPDGGAIDPSPVVEASGAAHLTWRRGDVIVSQPLSADGRSLVGERTELLRPSEPWEGGVVEGPSMVSMQDRWYLFYSANRWETRDYAIGYATCAGPAGPCIKQPGPWLGSGDDVQGPGGPEFFTDSSGRRWLTLHAWTDGEIGYPEGARSFFAVQVTFPGGVPTAR